jgi:hypothetical protein
MAHNSSSLRKKTFLNTLKQFRDKISRQTFLEIAQRLSFVAALYSKCYLVQIYVVNGINWRVYRAYGQVQGSEGTNTYEWKDYAHYKAL